MKSHSTVWRQPTATRPLLSCQAGKQVGGSTGLYRCESEGWVTAPPTSTLIYEKRKNVNEQLRRQRWGRCWQNHSGDKLTVNPPVSHPLSVLDHYTTTKITQVNIKCSLKLSVINTFFESWVKFYSHPGLITARAVESRNHFNRTCLTKWRKLKDLKKQHIMLWYKETQEKMKKQTLNLITACAMLCSNNCNQAFVITRDVSFTSLWRTFGKRFAEQFEFSHIWGFSCYSRCKARTLSWLLQNLVTSWMSRCYGSSPLFQAFSISRSCLSLWFTDVTTLWEWLCDTLQTDRCQWLCFFICSCIDVLVFQISQPTSLCQTGSIGVAVIRPECGQWHWTPVSKQMWFITVSSWFRKECDYLFT